MSQVDFGKLRSLVSGFVDKFHAASFGESLYIQMADCLRSILSRSDFDLSNELINLSESSNNTFNSQWPGIEKLLEKGDVKIDILLERIFNFLSWCYIESIWRGEAILDEDNSCIVKYALGLDKSLDSKSTMHAVRTLIRLPSNLLFESFNSSIKGGLNTIHGIQDKISNEINAWDENIKAKESNLNKLESDISRHEKNLIDLKSEFGFLALASAFTSMRSNKEDDRKNLLYALLIVSVIIIFMPVLAYKTINGQSQVDNLMVNIKEISNINSATNNLLSDKEKSVVIANKDNKESNKSSVDTDGVDKQYTDKKSNTVLEKYYSNLPLVSVFVAIEAFLVYFFRILLFYYNSTKAQLLQIDTKIAVIQFIQDYVGFKKENKDVDLKKFESLIFGGIVSDLNNIPSAFDLVDQISGALKNK